MPILELQDDALVQHSVCCGAERSVFLRDLAAEGTGILIISQDLDELMEISDTFAVLEGGRLSDVSRTGSLTVDEIGLMMGGTLRQEGAHALS